MPKEQGLLRRVLLRACPQFLEDWIGSAGQRFRLGLTALSNYNRDHLQLGGKVDKAPTVLWRAAEGAASVQHAKAEADYAKAENDRIEAELRKRTLAAKARQEDAKASHAEAEAGVAQIREIQARLELFKQLNEIGVTVAIDSSLKLIVGSAPSRPPFKAADALELAEIEHIEPQLVEIRCPGVPMHGEMKLLRWLVSVGNRVEADDPIFEISTAAVDSEIPCKVAGVLVEITVATGTIVLDQVLGRILPDA